MLFFLILYNSILSYIVDTMFSHRSIYKNSKFRWHQMDYLLGSSPFSGVSPQIPGVL